LTQAFQFHFPEAVVERGVVRQHRRIARIHQRLEAIDDLAVFHKDDRRPRDLAWHVGQFRKRTWKRAAIELWVACDFQHEVDPVRALRRRVDNR
jgi:hypothetical protein